MRYVRVREKERRTKNNQKIRVKIKKLFGKKSRSDRNIMENLRRILCITYVLTLV